MRRTDGRRSKAGTNALVLTLALCALWFICSFPTDAKAQSQAPDRFAILEPLTGGQALFGIDQVQAARWAVEDINKKSDRKGRPLEALVLDTQADPQIGIQMAERACGIEKVPVICGAFSVVVAAVAPIVNRNKVLFLSVGANSPRIAQLGDYVYTIFPLADIDVSALVKYAYNTLKKRRAAVLYVNNETGIFGAEIFRDEFKKIGGEVVSFQAYEPYATDFTAQVLQVKAGNPDVIHLHGLVAETPQVIAQIRQFGIKAQIISYQNAYNPKIVEQAGEAAAEGFTVASLAPPASDPNVKAYIDRWMKEKGREPYGLPYTQYWHDSSYFVDACFNWLKANSLPFTGENMRKALLTVRTFNTPLVGKVVINDNHTVDKTVYFMQVQKGKFVHIATSQ